MEALDCLELLIAQRHLEKEAVPFRVLCRGRDEHVEHGGDRLWAPIAREPLGREHLEYLGVGLFQVAARDLERDFALAGEVSIDSADTDSGRVGYVRRKRVMVALGPEYRGGCS